MRYRCPLTYLLTLGTCSGRSGAFFADGEYSTHRWFAGATSSVEHQRSAATSITVGGRHNTTHNCLSTSYVCAVQLSHYAVTCSVTCRVRAASTVVAVVKALKSLWQQMLSGQSTYTNAVSLVVVIGRRCSAPRKVTGGRSTLQVSVRMRDR